MRETTQYNTAELIQARQIMAARIHRDTARAKVVNSLIYWAIMARVAVFLGLRSKIVDMI